MLLPLRQVATMVLSSQPVSFVPGDNTNLSSVIPSVMICWLAEMSSAALYATMDISNGMINVRQWCQSCDKEHVKCNVHHIPNDFRIVDQPGRQSW
jgi:hypothetical protein